MNRTARIAFLASIILNVLLIGVLLGQVSRRFDRGAVRQQRFDQTLKDLPEAEQNRLRERFQKLRTAANPWFGQIRKAEDETVQLLGKENFDEVAFDRQVSKINDLRQNMTRQLSQMLKDLTKDLSASERRHFADLLRRPEAPRNS
jgi:uncharacterized membrane protein